MILVYAPGPREFLNGWLGWRRAEIRQLFILPGLLTVAWFLTILEMRVEKEKEKCYISWFYC